MSMKCFGIFERQVLTIHSQYQQLKLKVKKGNIEALERLAQIQSQAQILLANKQNSAQFYLENSLQLKDQIVQWHKGLTSILNKVAVGSEFNKITKGKQEVPWKRTLKKTDRSTSKEGFYKSANKQSEACGTVKDMRINNQGACKFKSKKKQLDKSIQGQKSSRSSLTQIDCYSSKGNMVNQDFSFGSEISAQAKIIKNTRVNPKNNNIFDAGRIDTSSNTKLSINHSIRSPNNNSNLRSVCNQTASNSVYRVKLDRADYQQILKIQNERSEKYIAKRFI